MVCESCGHETSRALQSCDRCGADLHASSPLAGVCPNCQVAVRESQIACFNCGKVLDPAALKEVPDVEEPTTPRAIRERRRRLMMVRLLWPMRTLGALIAIIAGLRVYEHLALFRISQSLPQEATEIAYAAVSFAVVLAGVGLVCFSFSLKSQA